MIEDIKKFLEKFRFNEQKLTKENLLFRMHLLQEEFSETNAAFYSEDAEEWIDGHIDLIVIAIGNLELAGVNTQKAWDEVQRANMSKIRGVKPGREESNGFDVLKPSGWKGPDHSDNHGRLKDILKN